MVFETKYLILQPTLHNTQLMLMCDALEENQYQSIIKARIIWQGNAKSVEKQQ